MTLIRLVPALVMAVLLSASAVVPRGGQTVTVTPVHAFVQVDAGERASVPFSVRSSDGRPLDDPVVVRGLGAAVVFPSGDKSGNIRTLRPSIPASAPAKAAPLTLALTATGGTVTAPSVIVNAHGFPYLDATLPVADRVKDLLGRMSLAEKAGQMTQADRKFVAPDPSAITSLGLGSVLSGGGSVPRPNTPAAWRDMVDLFQAYAMRTPLQIPLLYGVDAVHGHGNVTGATLFPQNIGLGSARDPELTRAVYAATAAEVHATGIRWDFAPCLCVTRDDRWGRTFESFGEDPALVARMGTAVDGLQSQGVLATVKHFAGDGDTEYGTGDSDFTIDQGVTVTSRKAFDRIDLAPYRSTIRAFRPATVMPSYSSVDWTGDGTGNPIKMHANRDLLTGTLRGELGFDGFVISDWAGIHQIPSPGGGDEPTPTQVRTAINAGVDMAMEPTTAPRFIATLRAEVAAGRVSTARIDEAVRRILTAKVALGLFERPYAGSTDLATVGSAEHRALAREAAAKSQVLLKNDGNVLPLREGTAVYLAGRSVDDVGNQSGGWTLDWQGRSGRDVPGATSIRDAIRPTARIVSSPSEAEVGIVAVGETPYAEGWGDVGSPPCPWCPQIQREPRLLSLTPGDRAEVKRVCAAVPKCVVLLVSGRPQVITDQLPGIDALVASWWPGSEGAGVADVLFGRVPFTGRLPLSWPASESQVPINVGDRDYEPLYPFGWGLTPGATGPRADVEKLVASGAAPEGWQAAFAAADQAESAGDRSTATALLRDLTRPTP